jgi:hypothetical protein
MDIDFEFLAVETLHRVSQSLAGGVRIGGANGNSARSSEIRAGSPSTDHAFGRAAPQTTIPKPQLSQDGRLTILQNDAASDPEAWWIFIRTAPETDGSTSSSARAGCIEAALRVGQFVTTAYEYILGRNVDPDGLAHYARSIETGQLPRQDFLKALASTDEAQRRNCRTIIVPTPSRWLRSNALTSEGTREAGHLAASLLSRSSESDVFSGDAITVKFN